MLRQASLAMVIGLTGVVQASAQGSNTTDIGQLAATPERSGGTLAFPAIFGAASAVAPAGGSGYVALTYANPRNGIAGSDGDGDVAAGYTFGNPVDAISVSVGIVVTGLDPFGDSGSFNISASRLLGSTDRSATFVGASALGLGGWGDAAADGESYAVYVSHLTSLGAGSAEIPLQLTLGYGNRTTLADDRSGRVEEGVFFGAGVGITETLSLSVSGTETQLNAGAVLSIPQLEGLSLSAGMFDILDNTDRQQFTATVAYSF
ncbi:hypothetical protein [Hasllibacter sp. MH4015]|uniref:hypothetical protein n=1 Tax=Hasllibacter sp. MH4015 TaxID=2854029 RepID=UPI001CD7C11D|nr:hypothetical protein [Hasllibacter sp. MH4015]